jgi:hypothetical protein
MKRISGEKKEICEKRRMRREERISFFFAKKNIFLIRISAEKYSLNA